MLLPAVATNVSFLVVSGDAGGQVAKWLADQRVCEDPQNTSGECDHVALWSVQCRQSGCVVTGEHCTIVNLVKIGQRYLIVSVCDGIQQLRWSRVMQECIGHNVGRQQCAKCYLMDCMPSEEQLGVCTAVSTFALLLQTVVFIYAVVDSRLLLGDMYVHLLVECEL